jgi:pectate lyase
MSFHKASTLGLIEGNVFANTTEPGKFFYAYSVPPNAEMRTIVSTYGFVIPDDSPENPSGDFEPDGFANFGAGRFIFDITV